MEGRQLSVAEAERDALIEVVDRLIEMAILNFHNGVSGDDVKDLVRWLGLTEAEYQRWVDEGARGLPL